jgi:endonuclease G
VPTHFFKVILAESNSKIEVLALVLPNMKTPKETPLSEFLVSVDDVERMSGLDFFNVLDKETEDEIEGEKALREWQ